MAMHPQTKAIHKGPVVYFRPTEAREELDYWEGYELGNLLHLWQGAVTFTKLDIRYLEGIIAGGFKYERPINQIIAAIKLHGSIEVFVEKRYQHRDSGAVLDLAGGDQR